MELDCKTSTGLREIDFTLKECTQKSQFKRLLGRVIIFALQGSQKRREGFENILEEVLAETSLIWGRKVTQAKEVQRVSCRISPKRNTLKCLHCNQNDRNQR